MKTLKAILRPNISWLVHNPKIREGRSLRVELWRFAPKLNTPLACVRKSREWYATLKSHYVGNAKTLKVILRPSISGVVCNPKV